MNIVCCFMLGQGILVACTGSTEDCDGRSGATACCVMMGGQIFVCVLNQNFRVQFLSDN